MYDLLLEQAEVSEIIRETTFTTLIWVEIDGQKRSKAINYRQLTGPVKIGDQVLVNTTAVNLKLGTGGYHFVYLNLNMVNKQQLRKDNLAEKYNSDEFDQKVGHIMKMRYTPIQIRTFCAEEQASPYHQQIEKFKNLNKMPVVIIPLHSLLAPLAITYKYFYPDKKIVYIMSEGGGLALGFSNLVRELLEKGYLDKTITYGHAFGGDYETVNIYTALAVADVVAAADLIVVGMGPGIVGTATKYGFSGVENVIIAEAVRTLKGKCIMVPRVSLADKRPRHYGLSHHTVTLLEDLISHPLELAFPDHDYLRELVRKLSLTNKHNIKFYDTKQVEDILKNTNVKFKSMGRDFAADPLFFTTAGLAVYKINGDQD